MVKLAICLRKERFAMNETQGEISTDPAVLMARQAVYRFAALTLVDPKTGVRDQLDSLARTPLISEAAALIRSLPEALPQELGLGERQLTELDPAKVLARLPGSDQAFNEEYEKTFGLLVSNACPPYETEYIDSKFTYQRSNSLADISGFYHAFGLTLSTTHPERSDHIVQELEFMAFLVGLERQAAEADLSVRGERLDVCRAAQTQFLREHLCWWSPAFARLLSHENPGSFYDAAGEFLAALIPAERALLGVEVPRHEVEPSQLERPEECEGCELVNQ